METTVEIDMGTWTDQRGNIGVHLRITDGPSGEALATVNLTPEQWLRLTNGTSLTLPSRRSPHMDRVGRRMVTRSAEVPYAEARQRDDEAAALDWARAYANGAETSEVRLTNHGWKAIWRTWVETSTA